MSPHTPFTDTFSFTALAFGFATRERDYGFTEPSECGREPRNPLALPKLNALTATASSLRHIGAKSSCGWRVELKPEMAPLCEYSLDTPFP